MTLKVNENKHKMMPSTEEPQEEKMSRQAFKSELQVRLCGGTAVENRYFKL